MTDEHGRWLPLLSPKGFRLFNLKKRYLLVHGPRKSGKTVSVVHKIARHAFEYEATIAFVTRTIRTAKSGVWNDDLLKLVVPQWVNAGIGFEITKPPSMTADSKMTYFRVRNMYGTESEFQLHSLDYAYDVEEKFKGTRFSAIYLAEADQFEDRVVFDILSDQLRMPHIPFDDHMLIADTNPPEDGEDHWLHEIFFDPGEDTLKAHPDYFEDYQHMLFLLDDNPFIEDKEKEDLKRRYASDANKYARFVEGKWIKDKRNSVFSDILLPNIHFVGETEAKDEDEWESLVPAPNTFELVTGWDLGDVNHAAVIVSPRLVGETTVWDQIDELLYIDEKISIERFTLEFMEKMQFWADFMKEEYGTKEILWRHWSDNSSMRYKSAADSSEELIVRAVSRGQINLMAVQKGSGTVAARKNLLRNMLFHKRYFVGATCFGTIEMLEGLKKGKTASQPIDIKSKHKHIFDAVTYLLYNEAPLEIERQGTPKRKERISASIQL